MNGSYLGRWTISPGGEHRLYYAQSWLESPESRPLSLALPLQPANLHYKGPIVENFFNNLLPDSYNIRQRIQRRFGTASQLAFDLLSETGRDCIGAIQILPEGQVPASVQAITGKPLDDEGVEDILRRTTEVDLFRTGSSDDFRISLAGAQEKNALLFHNGTWLKPTGSTPSTHIFKLPIGDIGFADLSTSVENEWLCMQILNRFGIKTADYRMGQFGDIKVLIVERFDRRLSDDRKWIIRLPQEDFCQATGTPSGLKYESDGGPGMKTILDILRYSNNNTNDRRNFLKTQILFWLLAAPDGHAKNFSIHLYPKGSFQLTPLYDVLSAYPIMGKGRGLIYPGDLKMAMAVMGKNRHYNWQKIRRDHWLSSGTAAGIDAQTVNRIFQELIESAPGVIENVQSALPPGFPESLAASILGGLKAAVERLKI